MQRLAEYRSMISGILVVAAVTIASPDEARGQTGPGPDEWAIELEATTLGETGLVIDRPLGWRRGGMYGANLLISLLGGTGMYPNFNGFLEELPGSDPTAAIDETFEELMVLLSEAEVYEAAWISPNGITAHRSIVSWSSYAGRLKALRLFVPVPDGVAVLTWVAEEVLFDQIADLFDRCAESLRADAE